MRNLWVIKPKPKDEIVSLLEDEVRLPKALATILAQRGIVNFDLAKEFFRPDLSKLYDPFLMADMQLAVDRVLEAIQRSEEHTSELQSRGQLVCRLLLDKKKF